MIGVLIFIPAEPLLSATAFPTRSPAAARGIACVLFGCFCLSVSDSFAKWLGEYFSPLQLVFMRGVIAAPLVALVAIRANGLQSLVTVHPFLHLARGAINVAAAFCFYLSLTYIPLAEATAIAFSAPLFVTLLSVVVLRERVGAWAWCAVWMGFAGVLVTVRPGWGGFHPAALLPLTAAVGYAVMMLTARRIRAEERLTTTAFYIVVAQVAASALLQPWVWRPIDASQFAGMAALAVFSTLGLTFVTQAFRLAPPAVVAPFDYSGLIWGALFGWIFWGEALDAWTYVGAGLIAAGGILVVTRQPRGDEHVAASEERCSRNNEAGGSKADALPQVGKCQNCD